MTESRPGDTENRRILVIDDEAILASNIQKYLERREYDVRVAGDGEDGLARLQSFRPDLVVLDYRLPDMDGLAVLERIGEAMSDVKTIMITAHGNPAVAVSAKHAGAYEYLPKPLALCELAQLIDEALAS